MEAGLLAEFGLDEIRDTVEYSGRTDRAIGRDLLTVHGIDPTPANQVRLQNAYLAHLPDSLTTHGGKVCPGVSGTARRTCARGRASCSVSSPATSAAARRHKLGHFGLWDFFACGGFGDEHYERDDVARTAVAEVRARTSAATSTPATCG